MLFLPVEEKILSSLFPVIQQAIKQINQVHYLFLFPPEERSDAQTRQNFKGLSTMVKKSAYLGSPRFYSNKRRARVTSFLETRLVGMETVIPIFG